MRIPFFDSEPVKRAKNTFQFEQKQEQQNSDSD
jgi:hypothetical protein